MDKEGRSAMKIKRDLEAFEKRDEFIFPYLGFNFCWYVQ